MRNLKYAILGLLNRKSMTGYELMQEFEGPLSEFWTAKHSQIYPELKRLTEEKMVEYEIQISGTVLEKKVYTLTENGRQDFLEWLHQDEALSPTPKDVFRLRLFYAKDLEPENRKKMISNELSRHKERLEQLRKNQSVFSGIPDKNTDEFFDYLVLLGAIKREEAHCEWLKKCLELCS